MPVHLVIGEDLEVTPEVAFARLCSVETWPVWLSLVKRTDVHPAQGHLRHGSDVTLWSELYRDQPDLYEVEEIIPPYILVFVGAYSCRRRLEFRLERRGERSRLVVKMSYPVYGGRLFEALDRITVRPKLIAALQHSLQTFRGLVEHDAADLLERVGA